MKEISAVEWLRDQLECFGNKHELTISWTTLDDLVDQAKEMEKEQIIKSLDYHLTKSQLVFIVAFNLKPYMDGNQWCILLGENIQEGVFGCGNSPFLAINNFNNEMYKSLKQQE